MSDTKTERQRLPETVEQLKKLRMKLFSEHISTARVAAYHLSWLQDDGLAILKEALFGDYSRTTKKAAAYGMRNMKGRMKKEAVEALEQGLKHHDKTTQSACLKSLQLLRGEPVTEKKMSRHKRPGGQRRVQSVSGNNRNHRNNRDDNRRPATAGNKGSRYNR
ncbi:MAG: HEAT repeat domain-containing protein [Planctomycetota bacterium]|jgi:hypothetical protein